MSLVGLLDLGGTKLLAAAAEPGGPPGPALRLPTPAREPLQALHGLLDQVLRGRHPSAIAMSVPGPFDRRTGSLDQPPGMPPAWHGLQLAAELGGRHGCSVLLENDANCAALAEARQGAGRGLRTVVYFTVSTGIGSGVVRDGRLQLGRHDTEGGHQVLWPGWTGGPRCDCGAHGCLETLASGRAIRRRFGVPPEQLEDPAAWVEVGRWLGLAVVNATALLDPDCVILGGGVCAAWDRFAPALLEVVDSELNLQPAPLIRRAELGEERNLIGALALIRDRP